MSDRGAIYRPATRFPNRLITAGLFCVLLLLMANGCATTVDRSQTALSTVDDRPTEQMLRSEIQSWLGTPHRLGGMNRRGIDCSGLVVILYDDLFELPLPRTTTALMSTGQQVKRKNLVAGDLVFFKPGLKSRHVGIYLGRGEFAHASTSSGVMISRMDDDFWQRCYLTGRRVRYPD